MLRLSALVVSAMLAFVPLALANNGGPPTFPKTGGPPFAAGVWGSFADPALPYVFVQNAKGYASSTGGVATPTSSENGVYLSYKCLGSNAYQAIYKFRSSTGGQWSYQCETGKVTATQFISAYTASGNFSCIPVVQVASKGDTYARLNNALKPAVISDIVAELGAKVFAVDGCQLHMHGAPRTRWTKLTTDVSAGATTISVAGAAGWAAGDQIVIATSDVDMEHRDVATIASLSGTAVTLTAPLRFAHFGTVRTVGAVRIDVRAEVGLFTRPIILGREDVDHGRSRHSVPGGFVVLRPAQPPKEDRPGVPPRSPRP
ncbi:hypothetical protein DFJ74DRAFT_766398 [Hyaloraphidium curvatum]|nr:hypothetical protein DFJ74DRAFT_766398 [Hyaloraphidium curvatum]